ncbi:MAG: hypothetical protein WCK82_14775 [Bacteroidota bacterium]
MEIKIEITKENDDGSANAMVHFDKEGLELLVQEGMLSILKQYIELNKNAQEGQKLRKKMEINHHKNGKVTNKKVKL